MAKVGARTLCSIPGEQQNSRPDCGMDHPVYGGHGDGRVVPARAGIKADRQQITEALAVYRERRHLQPDFLKGIFVPSRHMAWRFCLPHQRALWYTHVNCGSLPCAISTVSYAGDTHFRKHSLEYSLNSWSQQKEKFSKGIFVPFTKGE